MSELTRLIRYSYDARVAHCRVVKWRITDAQAMSLAMEIQSSPWDWKRTYDAMKAGTTHIFGARIEVKP